MDAQQAEDWNAWFAKNFDTHFKARRDKLGERIIEALVIHRLNPMQDDVQRLADISSGELSALTSLLIDLSAEVDRLRQRVDELETRMDAGA